MCSGGRSSSWQESNARRRSPAIPSRLDRTACGSVCTRLALHGAPADIVAAEAVGPADERNRLVGARLRLAHSLADRRDVEHTAAVGENSAAFGLGAGVKDLHALDLGGLVEAFDHRAALVIAWIAV